MSVVKTFNDSKKAAQSEFHSHQFTQKEQLKGTQSQTPYNP